MLSSTARSDRSSFRGSVREVPRIVPPSARIRAASRGRSGRGSASPSRPAHPSAIPKPSCPRELARSTAARMAAFRPGASPPPVRTPIRTATRDQAGGPLVLRPAFLPRDGLIELFGRDRLYQRQDFAQPARMAFRLEAALHLERFAELFVRQDALLDEVLAEALDRGRIAEQSAKRVDEIDRPEWFHEIV